MATSPSEVEWDGIEPLVSASSIGGDSADEADQVGHADPAGQAVEGGKVDACASPSKKAPESALVIAKVFAVSDRSVRVVYSIGTDPYCQDAIAVAGQALTPSDIGADVVIAFSDRDFSRPIVLGKLLGASGVGSELKFESDHQITLRCGKACISLKSDGTVAIRGTNVASRASHTNRIRGGNVQIN